jgi:hypothetical protein
VANQADLPDDGPRGQLRDATGIGVPVGPSAVTSAADHVRVVAASLPRLTLSMCQLLIESHS